MTDTSTTTIAELKLLSAKDVAELIGLSPWSVRKMLRDGSLPSIRFSPGKHGSKRVRLADLEAFIEAHRQEKNGA